MNEMITGCIGMAFVWSRLFDFLFILAGIGILASFLTVAGIKRFLKNKRNNKHEVIRPITDIISDDSERIAKLNSDLEPAGFAYDPNQDIFYSIMNGWQRDFGYCRLYDEASAPLSMIIDCEPIRFEYNKKKWLIEFWKGQYGMNTGGEVGIYYTDGPDLNIPGIFNGTFYYTARDEDRINMSFALRKNGNLLFTRSDFHWWITGFKLAEFSQPSELSMDIILTLTDKQMCNAFVTALKKAGYENNEFTVRGRTVNIHYARPHTTQPFSRTPLTVYLIQSNNEAFCNAYDYLTEGYTDTLDKLDYIRTESPNMYRQIIHMGKPKQVYSGFESLEDFLKKPSMLSQSIGKE